ncbi:MAG: UvrD-helicase domain-containing protein [Cyclobacteriaceae bacterium]
MSEIKKWILSQQDILDKITSEACREFWEANKSNPNFQYDLKQSHSESYELVNGRDLCYDRYTTAITYTLWYHPRRINTFLSFFIDHVLSWSGQRIQLFDLGAGTGAVQWTILLAAYAMKKFGIKPPEVHIINIDTSPFMLYFNRDYLWQHFAKEYDLSEININIEYSINSWNNEYHLKSTNTIIASSYLFDASDNKEKIQADFVELVKKYDPSSLLLLTSNNKRPYLDSMKKDFLDLGYTIDNSSNSPLLFSNQLTEINRFRRELHGSYSEVSPLSRGSSWRDPSYYGLVITKQQAGLAFEADKPIEKIDLFSPPIKVITEIKLNDNQVKASRFSKTPSVIIGPAGCGKSIVIAHKVFNTIQEHAYSKSLKILITTFNKSLVTQLNTWLKDLLDSKKVKVTFFKNVFNYWFEGSEFPNIKIMHFDILPLRIGSVPFYGLVNEPDHLRILDQLIEKVKNTENITDDRYDNILNSTFLYEEYHRVIYGLEVGVSGAADSYQTITRVGRGNVPSMKKNGKRRRLVFSVLSAYAKHVFHKNIPSYTIRRQRFLKELENFNDDKKYDYLFIDEFQDCTQADFRIFNLLLKDPDHLCIAGDLAQAVHIGKSARIPRFEDMARRNIHRLEGSYRLPVRISEAIKPISEAIEFSFNSEDGVSVITPYKGSPPGARPIIIYGSDYDNLVSKIQSVFHTYSIFEIEKATILEKDYNLSNRLNRLGITSETDTILRLKGLEKRCIIWSTMAMIEYEREVYEFVYTILSRTSSILLIAIMDGTLELYGPVLGKLNKNRLIFWDKDSELKFNSIAIKSDLEASIDQ